MNAENPYQAPASLEFADSSESRKAVEPRQIDWVAWLGWPLTLALNLPLALLWSGPFTVQHGRQGMLAAVAVACVAGWFVCYVRPRLMRRFLGGAVVVALLQIIPVAHFFAGTLSLNLAQALGLVDSPTEFDMEQIRSELGGFFVTAVTGGLLLALAALLSWLRYLIGSRRERARESSLGA